MNSNRRVFFFLAALGLIFGLIVTSWIPAKAQAEPTSFQNVLLSVYPEYDDPRLLVMLQGTINGADIPATVRFLVPFTAEMYSAGSIDAQGKYSGGPPRRQASSIPGWDEISYEVATDTFRVEYYTNGIIGPVNKTISFDFYTLYPISGLIIEIQEPRTSTNFSVSLGNVTKNSDKGLVYNIYDYPSLDTAQPLHFDISYTKSDPRPSLTLTGGNSNKLPLIVGIVVGLCVLAVALWFYMSRPGRRKAPKQAGRPRSQAKGTKPPDKFCIHCGYRLERSHRFCPNCGARLNKSK